jgi:poly(3-hydroxybutyrate) depolymerase
MLKNCYRLALLAGLLFVSGTIAWAGFSRESIRYAGADRHYFISVPSTYLPEKLYPLLMVFHGGGGNAEQVLQSSDLVQRAEKEGWIYPSPLKADGRKRAGPTIRSRCGRRSRLRSSG